MLIEAVRRAEAAAMEMLDCINAGSTTCTEVREALEVAKAFTAVTSALQVGAAQVISGGPTVCGPHIFVSRASRTASRSALLIAAP